MLQQFPVPIKTQLYITPNINFYYPYVLYAGRSRKINYTIYNHMLKLNRDLTVPDIPTYINGSYEIKTNERGVLSLSLEGLANFGGAHPNTMINSMSFDVTSGHNYLLSELFKPNSNYVEILSRKVLIQLKEQEIPLFDDYPGIEPNQDYYIADKSLVIYFQLYQIAPYVAGFPYAVIPIYQIQDIILENSLLEKML